MNPIAVHDHLSPMGVFLDAAPAVKLIMACLLVSMVAALIICAGKLASGPRLSGGSAFLSGLRLGGPILGLLGAAWTGLSMSLGFANAPSPAPVSVLAHGYAEIMLLVVIGLMAGAVAVIANWAVEARIDRAVLKA